MSRTFFVSVAVLVVLVIGGWLYVSQSNVGTVSDERLSPTGQESVRGKTQILPETALPQPSVSETEKTLYTSKGAIFSHPTDGYSFTYDSSKLEAGVAVTTEFPSNTGLQPSSVVTSGGGYMQDVEILAYDGSLDSAQEAFINAYSQYYDPQILGIEEVFINGNRTRIVTYKVTASYPEAKVYLIAYKQNEPRTIVAIGDYSVIATIKSQ